MHRCIAFLPQGFARYETTAADNIAYGDRQRLLECPQQIQTTAISAGVHVPGPFAVVSFSGRTIDVLSMFIAGKSDWGAYQRPGSLERMQTSACTRLGRLAATS
jgi:hypothetical protein